MEGGLCASCRCGDGGAVHEASEDVEHEQVGEQGGQDALVDVAVLVVAYLVGEDADYLFGGELLHECVVEDDALAAAEAGEVGVGVGRAPGAVDDVDVFESELYLGGEGFDAPAQFAFLKGLLLVEEGHDEVGVEEGHEEGEAGEDAPGYNPEVFRNDVVDPHEDGDDAAADDDGEQQFLDGVEDVCTGRCAVEAELLFDDEGAVDAEGYAGNPGAEKDEAEEYLSCDYGAAAGSVRPVVEQGEAAKGEEADEDGGVHAGVDVADPRVQPAVELLAAVGLLVIQTAQD